MYSELDRLIADVGTRFPTVKVRELDDLVRETEYPAINFAVENSNARLGYNWIVTVYVHAMLPSKEEIAQLHGLLNRPAVGVVLGARILRINNTQDNKVFEGVLKLDMVVGPVYPGSYSPLLPGTDPATNAIFNQGDETFVAPIVSN